MVIENNIKQLLKNELADSKSIWIATAMMSYFGWKFIQDSINKAITQHYLIGIDLSTEPSVFESILKNISTINARVYQTQYTFHPKVYLIQKHDNSFIAFVGSSNTTSWGLEKNVEMNFQIDDQSECRRLLKWFYSLYSDGILITEKFVDDYKAKYKTANIKKEEIKIECEEFKKSILTSSGQFFSENNHAIFNEKYHPVNNEDAKQIRREVREKFKKLHKIIYPQFKNYGLNDLHSHYNNNQIVSRHYPNKFSGNSINAMWLHYGKSKQQLSRYENGEKSINRPDSFINNIRLQVIIHDDNIGIWLVLGRSHGSKADRDYFRSQMQDKVIRKKFFDVYKKLDSEYYLHVNDFAGFENINSPDDLWKETRKENIDSYFIIGYDINWLDTKLSNENLPNTVLEGFKKLYPLYEIMRDLPTAAGALL